MPLHVNIFKPAHDNTNRQAYPFKYVYKGEDARIVRVQGDSAREVSDSITTTMMQWDDEADSYSGLLDYISHDIKYGISTFYVICFKPKELDTVDMKYTTLEDKMEMILDYLHDDERFKELISEYEDSQTNAAPDVVMGNYISGMYPFIVISIGSSGRKIVRGFKYDSVEMQTFYVDENKSDIHKAKRITIPEHIVSHQFIRVLRDVELYNVFNFVDMSIFSDDKLNVEIFKLQFNESLVESLAETIMIKLKMPTTEGVKHELSDITYVKGKGDEYHGTNPKILAKIKMEIHYKTGIYNTGGEIEFDIQTSQIAFTETFPKGGRTFNVYALSSNITENVVYNFNEYFKNRINRWILKFLILILLIRCF